MSIKNTEIDVDLRTNLFMALSFQKMLMIMGFHHVDLFTQLFRLRK